VTQAIGTWELEVILKKLIIYPLSQFLFHFF